MITLRVPGFEHPPKADISLCVDATKAETYEKVFANEPFLKRFSEIDRQAGFVHPSNRAVYDCILRGVFQSLTGERLTDCVSIRVSPRGQYIEEILRIFGSEETFKEMIGNNPSHLQGVNLDGRLIISEDTGTPFVVPHLLHEIGHRVYYPSATHYDAELGANYFMFLGMKKLETELRPHGLSFPDVSYRDELDDDHRWALRDAQIIMGASMSYAHKKA